jgi:hypothetical protein
VGGVFSLRETAKRVVVHGLDVAHIQVQLAYLAPTQAVEVTHGMMALNPQLACRVSRLRRVGWVGERGSGG